MAEGSAEVTAPAAGAPAPPRRRWLRVTLIGLAGLAVCAGVLVLAYQLALARVPQHRAALERLVRAHTGLDMRFEELGLRWGWYGPEAVFRRVEFGEPESPGMLLRAAELVVGFDAWRTMQSGQLRAARITLVTPDIDLARLQRRPAAAGESAPAARQSRAVLLERWPQVRMDIEGGVVRVPGPEGARPLSLQLRRASLWRSENAWSASAYLFLPERLGRTLRVVLRLEGEPARPDGSLRFEGRRLVFASWRELLTERFAAARHLPAAGGGDVSVLLQVRDGRTTAAEGEVLADGVSFAPPRWAPSGQALALGYLRGEWRLETRGPEWRLEVEELAFGPAGRDAPRTTLAMSGRDGFEHVEGRLAAAAVRSVVPVASWLAPHFDFADVELAGMARDVSFDWDSGRVEGERLRASAALERLELAGRDGSFALRGIDAALTVSERQIVAEIDSRGSRLELAEAEPLENLQVSTRLELRPAEPGWEVATERLILEHPDGRLTLSGGLRARGEEPAAVRVRGTLENADALLLARLLGRRGAMFAGAAERLTAGRIPAAQFLLAGAADELPFGPGARGFSGTLTLADAAFAATEDWPAIEDADARIEWRGARFRADFESGSGGPFTLDTLRAEWDAEGKRPASLAGRVDGRLEEVLAWLNEHPTLQVHVPHAAALQARGALLLDFEVTVPPASAGGRQAAGDAPRVRLAASLRDTEVSLAPDLPPFAGLRGVLAYDDGRLQRSTLTGNWLGGPLSLRIAERRAADGAASLHVRAQGLADGRELAQVIGLGTEPPFEGRTSWNGDLELAPPADEGPAAWRLSVSSALVGLASALPEPLSKEADTSLPLTVEAEGRAGRARLLLGLGERLHGAIVLDRTADGWRMERGTVSFGGAAEVPAEPLLSLHGQVARLDLPALLGLWRNLARETGLPPLRAELTVGTLLAAGRRFGQVELRAAQDEGGVELRMDSPAIAGTVQLPVPAEAGQPIDVHLAHLDLSASERPAAALADLSPGTTVRLSAERFALDGRPLGSLAANVAAREEEIRVDELELAHPAHDARATVRCERDSGSCRMSFTLESRDAAATLRSFGFRDELAAERASLRGELGWPLQPDGPWLAGVAGQIELELADGTTRIVADPAGTPFPLLPIPALVRRAEGVPSEQAPPEQGIEQLAFARLEADFELRQGDAFTSNLHFDGEAEILMRGRTGLTARDYDYEAWVLRGEDRLPAPVRRLGATPRVAAAWISLRELFSDPDTDRSRVVLHLGGTWKEPVVEMAESRGER